MSNEVEVTWREIELLVVAGIVGNMHLAVEAGDGAGLVDHDGRVVIDALGPALKNRRDYDDLVYCRDASEAFGRWPRNRLGEIEHVVALGLAEVLRPIKFLQANYRGAALRGLLDSARGLFEIRSRIGCA